MKSARCYAKDASLHLARNRWTRWHSASEAEEVNEWLMQVREFRRLMEEVEDFPCNISMT